MAEGKICTGRCELCTPNQRAYCTAQKVYYLEQDIADIKRLLAGKDDDAITTIVAKEDIENEA